MGTSPEVRAMFEASVADLASRSQPVPEAAREAEPSAAWREFNVNGYFRLRLTDVGRQLHRRNHYDLFDGWDPMPEYHPPKPDADGWVKMQAWEVMREFGAHIRMGRPVPFETTVLVELPTGPSGSAQGNSGRTEK